MLILRKRLTSRLSSSTLEKGELIWATLLSLQAGYWQCVSETRNNWRFRARHGLGCTADTQKLSTTDKKLQQWGPNMAELQWRAKNIVLVLNSDGCSILRNKQVHLSENGSIISPMKKMCSYFVCNLCACVLAGDERLIYITSHAVRIESSCQTWCL